MLDNHAKRRVTVEGLPACGNSAGRNGVVHGASRPDLRGRRKRGQWGPSSGPNVGEAGWNGESRYPW